jgi:hypothetical protein
MHYHNSATGLSNFYFISLNNNDTILNYQLKDDDFPKKYLIQILN